VDLEGTGVTPDAPQICDTETPVYGVVSTSSTLCSIRIACSVLVHFNAVSVFFVCIRHRVYIINKSIILLSCSPKEENTICKRAAKVREETRGRTIQLLKILLPIEMHRLFRFPTFTATNSRIRALGY